MNVFKIASRLQTAVRPTRLLAALLLAALAQGAFAQATVARGVTEFGVDKGQVPVMELGLGYDYFHANAPPGGCGCFSLNGGGGTIIVNSLHGISLVGDLSAAHASQVNGSTQNITIFDYLFGLRYSYRSTRRFTPYVEGLAGGSNEISNYAYVQNSSGFAALGGIGVNHSINRLIALNLVEADYIYSRIANASNNRQSDFRVKTGIYFRFGTR